MIFNKRPLFLSLVLLLFVFKMSKAIAVKNSNRGIMMILSPAKTLDLSPLTRQPLPPFTLPDCSPEQTNEIAKVMKKHSESGLKTLLGISAALAKTSHGFWSQFTVGRNQKNGDGDHVKPSIFSFSGAAYQGLDILNRSDSALQYLQDNLRIIDPVYGLLRPLDLMQPYRLEMATKNVLGGDGPKKLSDYWSESITKTLTTELETREDPILLNLASEEYSSAVNSKKLPGRYVHVVFKDQGRVIAVHAKRARGLMCKYMSENSIACLEDVTKFDEEGYSFVKSDSSDDVLVFNRVAAPARKRVGVSATKTTNKRVKDK